MKENNNMLKKITNNELKKIEMKLLGNSNIQMIHTCQKFKIRKNITNVLIIINSSEISNHKQTKCLIKKLLKLQKVCIKKGIDWNILSNDESITAVLITEDDNIINTKFYNELDVVINLAMIKNKKDRIEYIYDKSCEYLDNESKRLNYCDFKNDVCIAKRSPCRGKERKMGCCYHVKLFSFKEHQLCEYLSKDGTCSTKCFACKLYTCDAIKEKFRIRDITYADCFFTLLQKIIIRISILTPKEKIISKLLLL